MNPRLILLKPYPFQKLQRLLADISIPHDRQASSINLSIGEPKHKPPAAVKKAISENLIGLSFYPTTKGSLKLRRTFTRWLANRYSIAEPNPDTQVLPILGSREALFSFTQISANVSDKPIVVCPNPFYQIYEGAALLAGAQPYFINVDSNYPFSYDWSSIPHRIWKKTSLLFICSPGNPTGTITSLDDWKKLFEFSDRYNFIIVSDECYSEIYRDEESPPLGGLQAAYILNRHDYHNLVCFFSLSKRSNVPGMRSGFVAGDANLLANFLLYRTYHGSAMSPVVASGSIAAWNDELHVKENRALYRQKFDAVLPILKPFLNTYLPQASFYLWAGIPKWTSIPNSDTMFVKKLYQHTGVTVLPGSFLARTAHGTNPGCGKIRIALVNELKECVEAAERISCFVKKIS